MPSDFNTLHPIECNEKVKTSRGTTFIWDLEGLNLEGFPSSTTKSYNGTFASDQKQPQICPFDQNLGLVHSQRKNY